MLLLKQFSTDTNFSIIDAFMVASWHKKGRQKGSRPRWMARSDRWRCDPAIAKPPVLKSTTLWGLQFTSSVQPSQARRLWQNLGQSSSTSCGASILWPRSTVADCVWCLFVAIIPIVLAGATCHQWLLQWVKCWRCCCCGDGGGLVVVVLVVCCWCCWCCQL